MSVYGGDSWARESQYRKRKLDDILIEGIHGSSYRKLHSGKYICLVCPNNPILDTPLMLSMHMKGSSHCNSESRLKEKELKKQNEINKRITLLGSSTFTEKSKTTNQKFKPVGKPLIEQTRKVTSELISSRPVLQVTKKESQHESLNTDHIANYAPTLGKNMSLPVIKGGDGSTVEEFFNFQEERERKLKFTAAGWKLDGHGKWFRDENVEFDSDEEDPNVCLG